MFSLAHLGRARRRRWAVRWAWLPLLVTAAVRAGWLAIFPVDPIGPIDPEGFHLLAVNLLAGRGFAIGWEPPFCPTAVRTPLYPLFVAAIYAVFGPDPGRVVPFHVLLEVLTAALAMALTRALLWQRDVACSSEDCPAGNVAVLAAGLLYACNGLTQRFTGYLFSETLLLTVMTLALFLTVLILRRATPARVAGAGLTWGLVLLTKPNVQYLALGVGALLSYRLVELAARRTSVSRARATANRNAATAPLSYGLGPPALFWLALGLILAPWALRNRLAVGRWVISTAFEENIARVSAVATEAALQGVVVEPWTETWEALYDDLEARAVPELAEPGLDKSNISCDVQATWQCQIAAEARRVVASHLGTYLSVHLRGVVRGLVDPGHRLWYRVLTGRDWSATGVVSSIAQRMVWSLERRAVGDALAAFWSQRVARIPPLAGVIWWGLVIGRAAIWLLVLRSLWRLRRQTLVAVTLAATITYHILLPGPIAHDRFYLPIVPVVVALLALLPSGKVAAVRNRSSPGERSYLQDRARRTFLEGASGQRANR